jgi:hypothetical protein
MTLKTTICSSICDVDIGNAYGPGCHRKVTHFYRTNDNKVVCRCDEHQLHLYGWDIWKEITPEDAVIVSVHGS